MAEIKVYYGLTNHSQLKRLPADANIMVSARWLLKWPWRSIAFDYLKRFNSLFLDSGAYGSALNDGGFRYSPDDYLSLVGKVQPDYWSSMDVCCEPSLPLSMTTRERVQETVRLAEILSRAPYPGFLPVIQGWRVSDYLYCIELLTRKGLIYPVMGIGSLCRRGKVEPILRVLREIHNSLPGVKFHTFGAKIRVLTYSLGEAQNYIHSIDTAAWQIKRVKDAGYYAKWRDHRADCYLAMFKDYRQRLSTILSEPFQLVLR